MNCLKVLRQVSAASVLGISALGAQTSGEVSKVTRAVEAGISGDRAFTTVDFVQRYFRLPGNRGFDLSIDTVAALLKAAGFTRADKPGSNERFSYRIESRAMDEPAWSPEAASLTLSGRSKPLLDFATNMNMLAINSNPTPVAGVTASVVDVGTGADSVLERSDVRGKIVFGEGSARTLFPRVMKRGALGVLFAQKLPDYNNQSKNVNSTQFSSVPHDTINNGWLLFLSAAAADSVRSALAAAPLAATVKIAARIESRPERTIVAEIAGTTRADERFVYSAHVQEPGANDNASGVGLLAEMARVAARLVLEGTVSPARTITFLWGTEIRATARFLSEDSTRRANIKWGMSLDMVGENTALTGGTFLIEKMPDPSAVWVRGEDQHSEWGGGAIKASAITPYWFNDFVRQRCLDRASRTGWVVKSNPFEGGSDHTPFLTAKIPAVLLWHFTDQYYHTSPDRIEMVSSATLANVGSCALTTGLLLASGSAEVARFALNELAQVAESAIKTQATLSDSARKNGSALATERKVIQTWRDYYVDAIAKVTDIPAGPTNLARDIGLAQSRVKKAADGVLAAMR